MSFARGGRGGGYGRGGGNSYGGGNDNYGSFGGGGGFGDSSFSGSGGTQEAGGFFQGGGVGDSSFNAAGEKKKHSTELMPVTVAEVVTFMERNEGNSDDSMKIHGLDIQRVTLVGQVKKVTPAHTFTSYTLDDKTGKTIEVKTWPDNQEDREALLKQLVVGKYVRVIGTIKTLMSAPHILGLHTEQIKDFNEVAMHMMEVAYAHAVAERKFNQNPTNGAASALSFSTNTPGALPEANGFDNFQEDYAPNLGLGMTAIQKQILTLISREGKKMGDAGMDYRGIAALIKVPAQLVKDTVDWLSGEGHIYTTTDDFHYLSTAG